LSRDTLLRPMEREPKPVRVGVWREEKGGHKNSKEEWLIKNIQGGKLGGRSNKGAQKQRGHLKKAGTCFEVGK